VTIHEDGAIGSSLGSSFKAALFVGSYLLVWALVGIGLLLGWSVVMNNTLMMSDNPASLSILYGSLLIIAGAYQFTPLKKTCMGYCESPMSFFMRRWKGGTFGAMQMGFWHGLYCLGCCWAYFLLMVALGWMNLLWMGLFAGIIFGEKMWSKGIWIARIAGGAIVMVGILVIAGVVPALVPTTASSMGDENGKSMDKVGGSDQTGAAQDSMGTMQEISGGASTAEGTSSSIKGADSTSSLQPSNHNGMQSGMHMR
jgi:hypothetical protein